MPEVNWETVERLIQTHYPADPLSDWERAWRIARHAAHMAQGLRPFDHDKARLLALFHGLAEKVAEPAERRGLTRPLLGAGVPLELQMWLWLALARYDKSPESNEEFAVKDACLLETVGALGVARALLRAGQTNDSLRSAVAAANAAVAQAEFITPAGRRLGVRRIISAKRILKELEEE